MGRSAECDYPATVADLPVVMRARTFDRDRPSAEIDRRVRGALARQESLYHLDVDLLRSLRPELILTQDLCQVCSVTGEEVARACEAAGVRPRIVVLSPGTLEEVWRSVETVGEAIGRTREARALTSRLRRRSAAAPSAARARVAVLEWLDPPMLAGLWTPSMIEAAGGTPVGPGPGEPASTADWGRVTALRPELLLLSPCSFPVERTLSELRNASLAGRARGSAPPGRVYVADEAYFSRPGPRLADGVELVRALLEGKVGPFPMPVVRLDAAGKVAE